MDLNSLLYSLLGVSAYRELLSAPPLSSLRALLEGLTAGQPHQALEAYAALFYHLSRERFAGLGDWFSHQLRYREAPYPLSVEEGREEPLLSAAAAADISLFRQLSLLPCDRYREALLPLLPGGEEAIAALPRWESSAPFDFDSLTHFYSTQGCGLFALYRAFLWEGGELRPVERPDCVREEELIGYHRQRDQVVANTRALLEGNRVNNVLLYGETGTGKSATVKSLLTLPHFQDLRLIELHKEELSGMPHLVRTLAHRKQKFILFIDDLAFDHDDGTYSVLKTILEGGVEHRPANVAVYATSNRRHLVRQTFSDRAGDEVDRTETIAEKTSLAERFGLRICYQALDKADFLSTVSRMALQRGISMDQEALFAQALRFEARHPGRTPRTALQFITALSAQAQNG